MASRSTTASAATTRRSPASTCRVRRGCCCAARRRRSRSTCTTSATQWSCSTRDLEPRAREQRIGRVHRVGSRISSRSGSMIAHAAGTYDEVIYWHRSAGDGGALGAGRWLDEDREIADLERYAINLSSRLHGPRAQVVDRAPSLGRSPACASGRSASWFMTWGCSWAGAGGGGHPVPQRAARTDGGRLQKVGVRRIDQRQAQGAGAQHRHGGGGEVFAANGLYFAARRRSDQAPQRLGAVGPMEIAGKRQEAVMVGAGASVELTWTWFCIDS